MVTDFRFFDRCLKVKLRIFLDVNARPVGRAGSCNGSATRVRDKTGQGDVKKRIVVTSAC